MIPRKRFWQAAGVHAEGDGFGVDLDGKPLRTPSGAALVVPTEALARAIADEWDAIEGEIRPDRLPLTRAANTAIDRVAPRPDPVIDAIAEYGGSDLLCYRAEAPEALVARQAAAWDPWLGWADVALGAPLVATQGIIHQAQPAASLAALRAAVARSGAFALTALHALVTVSGSLVLGLAVRDGALDAEAAFDLSRLDEIWQAEQWGLDPEAEAAARGRQTAFRDAVSLLSLLGVRS